MIVGGESAAIASYIAPDGRPSPEVHVIEAIAITVGSVLAGAMLGGLSRREGSWLGPLRTFAVAAVGTAVVVQLLPDAVAEIGGADKGKAIIILNPAEPPIIMRDTVHCLVKDDPDEEAITKSVHEMIKEVQKYVPGYTLKNGPVFDGKRVSIFLEVEGLGDYLPNYAGNLDIMTAAALRTAEMFAEEIVNGEITLEAVNA